MQGRQAAQQRRALDWRLCQIQLDLLRLPAPAGDTEAVRRHSMNDQPFTFEQLQKTIESLTPQLLYGTSELVERGQVYICNETNYSQQFVILHPDDLEQFSRSISHMRLVHLRDETKENMAERIRSRLTRRAADHAPVLESSDNSIDYHFNWWRGG